MKRLSLKVSYIAIQDTFSLQSSSLTKDALLVYSSIIASAFVTSTVP